MSSNKTNEQYRRWSSEHLSNAGFSSPFNFIELNNEVFPAYSEETDIPTAAMISDDYISGEISYSVKVNTPVLFENEPYDLSASMIRGLVRSNIQILGFTSLAKDIEDSTFRYRDITKGANSAHYASVMGKSITRTPNKNRNQIIYKNIRAGIMKSDDNGYYIIPSFSADGNGFYKINVREIQKKDSNWREHFSVKYGSSNNIFETVIDSHYSKSRYSRSIRDPFMIMVSWKDNTKGDIVAIGETNSFPNKGYLINPGFIYGSTTMYFIPDNNGGERIRISSKIASEYRNYVNTTKLNNRNFYQLPETGAEKPVFFVQREDQIDFGFTMLFPIRYSNSTYAGIPKQHFGNIIDYDMALFGYSDRLKSLNGRLVFEKPVPQKKNRHDTLRLLPEPKPQSSKSYVQDKDRLGYNSNHFSLRGIKQFWLHKEITTSDEVSKTPKSLTRLIGIDTGSEYKGLIRFFNLRRDELGLLLWSIQLNPGCDQNIGAGKAFGYGRITITIDNVRMRMPQQSWDTLSTSWIDLDPLEYIDYYQSVLDYFLNGNLKINKRLQDFFIMKNSLLIPNSSKVAYADIRAYRQLMDYPKIKDIVSAKQWLIIPATELDKYINVSWEEFIDNPPEELNYLENANSIVELYKEIIDILNLYRVNKKYIIRKEILLEYVSLLQTAEELNLGNNIMRNRSVRYQTLLRHVQECLNRIKDLREESDEVLTQFQKDSLPTFSFNIENESCSESLDQLSFIGKISVSEGAVPVKITSIGFYYNHQLLLECKKKFYIDGGEHYLSDYVIKIPESCKTYGFLPITTSLKYQYYFENTRKSGNFEYEIEIPLALGEYTMLQNPYSSWLGNPISDPEMFYGRDELIANIIEQIDSCSGDYLSGRNIIIYGQKRTGKSSVMHFVKRKLDENDNDKYVVVNIGNVGSLLKIVPENEKEQEHVNMKFFFKRMVDATKKVLRAEHADIYKQLIQDKVEFPTFRNGGDAEAMDESELFFTSLTQILYPQKRVVLLIDEFTYFYDLIQKGLIKNDFMRFWKGFIQNTQICTILIGQDFMDDFRNAFPNEFYSSNTIRISYLDKNAIAQLIQKPFIKYNGYKGFSDDAVDYIMKLTAGNAFFTMHLCSALVAYLNERKRERVITPNVIHQLLSEHWFNVDSNKRIDRAFFESLYNDGFRNEWNEDNLMILQTIARLEETTEWVDIADIYAIHSNENSDAYYYIMYCKDKLMRLIYRDVLAEKNNKVRIKVQLLSKWLSKK